MNDRMKKENAHTAYARIDVPLWLGRPDSIC